jgi:hypothetical protein
MNPCSVEISVNGKKVESSLNDINVFSDSLPPEVARLLMSQLELGQLPKSMPPAAPVADVKVNIRETISPEVGNDVVKNEIEAYLNAKKAESLVKTIPDHVQRALEQSEALGKIRNEKAHEFTIYESGVALGIVVGTTTRQEVTEIMKNYSKISFAADNTEPIYFYNDVFLYVYFDNQNTVMELRFVNDYIGATSKGLKLGDKIEKAIEIYNQPKMKSPKGAVWDRFAVFSDNNIINSIRIQK